jgi:hypothetical protein
MASNTTFTSGAILTAAQMNNLPWGIVAATAGGTSGAGYVRNTTTAVAITAAGGDVTGMTITWNALSTRIYKVTVTLNDINTGAGFNPFLLEITDASNVVKYQARRLFPAGDTDSITLTYLETGISGSTLRKVRAYGISNSGTFNTNAGSANSTYVIEDIGAT